METLYYTVEKQLQDIDGIGETTGYKDINLYKIRGNKPMLITTIEAENEYSTIDELNHFVEITITEDDDFGLDVEKTYLFEQL